MHQHRPHASALFNPPSDCSLKWGAIASSIVAVLALLFSTGEALAKGGMETTGGGDGVACFANPAQARIAKAELENQGFMSEQTRREIQKVTTLESWEYLQQFSMSTKTSNEKMVYLSEFLQAQRYTVAPELLKLKTADEIRQAVSKNLYHYVPLFVLRLKMVEEKAPVSSWIASTRVEQVEDSQSKRAISEDSGCVLIQLANRKTISTDGKFPVTKITYDEELFRKFLSPLDQTLLINHEYFYLIGREGNHLTSNDIRPFNTFIISDNMFPFAEDKGSLGSRAVLFRQIIGYPFGDYMRFFKEDVVPNKELKTFQSSRYRGLISMMEKIRENHTPYMEKCLSEKGFETAKSIPEKNAITRNCSQGIINANPMLWNSLTNEEAFLFFTRFYFDQFVIKDPVPANSELLTYPGDDTPFTNALAQLYCKLTHQRDVAMFSIVQGKMKEYCGRELGYSVVPGK